MELNGIEKPLSTFLILPPSCAPRFVCLVCGCNDDHPCQPAGCTWVAVDEKSSDGICSACAVYVARAAMVLSGATKPVSLLTLAQRLREQIFQRIDRLEFVVVPVFIPGPGLVCRNMAAVTERAEPTARPEAAAPELPADGPPDLG